jgi:hypothetical protein
MALRDLPIAERIALHLIALGFAFGTVTHGLDFIRFGWWPYRFGPPPLNVLWNALVVLDAAVVGLILSRRWTEGLGLAVLVMIVDVAANSYAWLGLGFDAFATSVPLQTVFLVFILATAAVFWRGRPSR